MEFGKNLKKKLNSEQIAEKNFNMQKLRCNY